MVEANLRIICELKDFLNLVTRDPEFRKVAILSSSDFTRERKLGIERIIGFIANLPKRSLSVELQDFFESLGIEGQAATKGAFSQQRTKLRPHFFQAWNKWLAECFYHYYGEKAKHWRGFRLYAVDGSTTYLVDRSEVTEHFGTQSNQFGSVPMARIVQIHDVLNNITVWGDIRPFRESEKRIFMERIPYLYKDSLTLFDRGFPSFLLFYLMASQEIPLHFLARCPVNFNKQVIDFMKSGKDSLTTHWTPNIDSIKSLHEFGYVVTRKTSIKIRMVRVVLESGEPEVLVTNLYDDQKYTVDDLYHLYGLRWGIETSYGVQKNQQQMEQFSGHRVICIQQDYAAGLFTANLQSLIEKQCDPYIETLNKRRKHKSKINRNVSWASLKNNIVRLFLEEDIESILKTLQEKFQRNVELVRPGRKIPRLYKRKRQNGKYQTFTNYRRAI